MRTEGEVEDCSANSLGSGGGRKEGMFFEDNSIGVTETEGDSFSRDKGVPIVARIEWC